MAVVTCPNCKAQLSIEDEFVDREVRCGGCQLPFVAKVPELPPPLPSLGETYSRRTREDGGDLDFRSEREDRYGRPRGRSGRGGISRSHRRYAMDQVSGPATGLQVVGWIGVVFAILYVVVSCVSVAALAGNFKPQQNPQPGDPDFETQATMNVVFYLGYAVILGAISWLILKGAAGMRQLENRSMAMVAAILAMIPCFSPCCLLGLPFGILALIALSDTDVADAFDAEAGYLVDRD